MISNTISNNISNVSKPKNNFETAIEALDLRGCLMMLTVLSQRAFYLQNKEVIDTPKVLKPLKNILHV